VVLLWRWLGSSVALLFFLLLPRLEATTTSFFSFSHLLLFYSLSLSLFRPPCPCVFLLVCLTSVSLLSLPFVRPCFPLLLSLPFFRFLPSSFFYLPSVSPMYSPLLLLSAFFLTAPHFLSCSLPYALPLCVFLRLFFSPLFRSVPPIFLSAPQFSFFFLFSSLSPSPLVCWLSLAFIRPENAMQW